MIAQVGNSITTSEPVLKEAERLLYQADDEGFPFEESFYVCDLNIVKERHELWNNCLPDIKPHYAVKCNHDITLLRTLADLGTSFDCATRQEMEIILGLGVDPSRILFAHPCKPGSHLRYAAKHNINKMTFDSLNELNKIHTYHPKGELVLRIVADDSNSTCPFSSKFGANVPKACLLLQRAQQLNLNVIGISFHVGSGCKDPNAYQQALRDSKFLFDFAKDLGIRMNLLDLGGGFPGHADGISPSFEFICKTIRSNLAELFPSKDDVTVIAEPGRFYATAPYTLVTRVCTANQNQFHLNDGLYGSFNCILFDHAVPTFEGYRLTKSGLDSLPVTSDSTKGTLWGPTCDAIDVLASQVPLPNLQEDDILLFPNMGAYTWSAATGFHGFPKPAIYYIPLTSQ